MLIAQIGQKDFSEVNHSSPCISCKTGFKTNFSNILPCKSFLVNEEFSKSGEDSRALVREWGEYISEASLLLKDANEELSERMKRHPNLVVLATSIEKELSSL